MTQPRHAQTVKRRPSKQMRVMYRAIFCVFMAAIIVRIIMVGLEALGARTGLPGGEIFIPLYIIVAPVFGWQLRGWQEPPKKRRKESRQCTVTTVKGVERPLTRESAAPVRAQSRTSAW